MTTIDPFASATELLDALRARKVTSSELTDLYIRRIERHDGRLNVVVVRDFARARQRARAADEAAARGERAALLGLPITLKESINVAGLATTCGVPEWKGFVSAHDAPTAARCCSARPTCLPCWQTGNRTTRSTGARAIRGTRAERPAGAVEGARPRWRPGSPPSRSAQTLAARFE